MSITQPVTQVEEKREEEEAVEHSSAYAVAEPSGAGRQMGGSLLMLVLLAGAGVGAAGVRTRRNHHAMRFATNAGGTQRVRPVKPRTRSRRA